MLTRTKILIGIAAAVLLATPQIKVAVELPAAPQVNATADLTQAEARGGGGGGGDHGSGETGRNRGDTHQTWCDINPNCNGFPAIVNYHYPRSSPYLSQQYVQRPVPQPQYAQQPAPSGGAYVPSLYARNVQVYASHVQVVQRVASVEPVRTKPHPRPETAPPLPSQRTTPQPSRPVSLPPPVLPAFAWLFGINS